MVIEIYDMQVENDLLRITLEAICDTFSSLIWDVRQYECGQFEVYIAATAQNVALFQKGRIIGRSDDKLNYGIIEKVRLDTDAENGDYLTVSGRFLMSILSRRIIYPTLSFTKETSYGEILRQAVYKNCIYPYWHPGESEMEAAKNRIIPGMQLGTVIGECWNEKTTLQISYENLMEWIYSICRVTGGIANLRLQESTPDSDLFTLQFDLSVGSDRSITQEENAHIIFSNEYNNLLSFTHEADGSSIVNFTYAYGDGEGSDRICMRNYYSKDVSGLNQYELYVDARDISRETEDESGETSTIPFEEYCALLAARAKEKAQKAPIETEEFEIAADSLQFRYGTDYAVGDYVTVQHSRFGLVQPKIQLTGMIESFDRNGRSLVPTFEVREV